MAAMVVSRLRVAAMRTPERTCMEIVISSSMAASAVVDSPSSAVSMYKSPASSIAWHVHGKISRGN
jgi:hypothetical protein